MTDTKRIYLVQRGARGAPGPTVTAQAGNAVALRSQMAAIATPQANQFATLTESGREGTFVFSGANNAANVTADPNQGVYVAPSSDTTGASGAWVRKVDGALKPEWFGVKAGDVAGANAAANDTAFSALKTLRAALAVNTNGNYRGLPAIKYGEGTYEFSAVHDFTAGSGVISGSGIGHGATTRAAGPTRLKFYGCTGFRFQTINTSGDATLDGTSHFGAEKSIIRDIMLEGTYAGTEAEFHGIHAKVQINCANVIVRNFAGDGFHLVGDDGVGGTGGSVDCSNFLNCEAWTCRDGFYMAGADASAMSFVGGQTQACRRWGWNDNGSLGNSYTGTLANINGSTSANDGVAIGAATVSSGGNLYYAKDGQETWCSTNAPSGTTANNQGWFYMTPGAPQAGFPAWFSGILVRAGGSYRATNPSTPNVYTGCYAEGAQGFAQLMQRCLVFGGVLGTYSVVKVADTAGANNPAVLYSTNGGVTSIVGAASVASGPVTVNIGRPTGNAVLSAMDMIHPTYAPTNGINVMFSTSGDLILTTALLDNLASIGWRYTGPSTTQQFGRLVSQPYSLYVPRLFVGDALANARQVTNGTAAPATGTYSNGDIVFNRAPNASGAGSNTGWICRVLGTPGTWKQFGGTAATPSATYVAATGGTTVDTQARASLVQLAADHADLIAKLQAAGLMI